ncbi:hypothetical protein GUITHDRAFT_108868 [Guillardia theta CCMP2712]|uniref:PDZ domain-containing protein n=1 Tax=Guillardia theta (strain CCMP2712) TaxID=905079 RepID=L1J9J6_GUITC|nr:hypothetical protein GUITHDRAFT_108868 [Guillardia theta CCMP2712]EKX45228.1 hypothetical protein GUITHDRAFT_108868 [Guillardia theta CCMP2712]|eukprot:XP_005832208.1 hypothetical protein GUITHDRAFT_108868 [Guillardia theta CCMP2712]
MEVIVWPCIGVCAAGGIILGGQVAEDWEKYNISRWLFWNLMNPLWYDSEKLRRPVLGLYISSEKPYVVEEINVLMDHLGKRNTEEGYANQEVKLGDRLLSINQLDVQDLPIQRVKRLLAGQPYTTVSLTFQREDQTPFEVTLLRHVREMKPTWASA